MLDLKTFKIYPLILILVVLCYSQTQTEIGPGLSGQDLWDFVYTNYKTTSTLGYTNARDTLYSIIDLHNDSLLTCVYTGFTIALDPSLDPSTDAYQMGINCEHTWPQSMGADSEPQKSDMHHLFPCKDNVNSSRGNDPYAEIPDQDTEKWFRLDYYQTTIPTEFIDEYAEKENDAPQSFEPREDHKGDAARAMFYFYAIYNDVANINFWNVQKDVLLLWHYNDPVDLWEYNRSNQIATYQDDIPNPFVLDSTLSRRIWFSSADTGIVDTTNYSIVINEIMQNPNAVNDEYGEWFELLNNDSVSVDLLDWTFRDNDYDSHTISSSVIIEPDSFVVFGVNAESDTNGGLLVDYEYSEIVLANGLDELILVSAQGIIIDSVAWDNGLTFPDPTGASMALLDANSDNSIGSNWQASVVSYGNGDYGTPGQENFPIIINTPPIAIPDSTVIDEDESTMIDVIANDIDLDGDSLILFSLDTTNTFGHASINDTLNQISYTPPLNYYGIDSVRYMVSDHIEGFDYASVHITITSVNDPPQDFAIIYPTIADTFSTNEACDSLIGYTWHSSSDIDSELDYKLTIELDFLNAVHSDIHEYITDTIFDISSHSLDVLLNDFNLDHSVFVWYVESFDGEYSAYSDSGQFFLTRSNLNSKSKAIVPQRFFIGQNYPNPFNPVTTIQYELPQRSVVKITIYDLLGKEVATLVSETQDAGYKSVQWDASNISSGMYFYKIRAGDHVQTRKMLVLK